MTNTIQGFQVSFTILESITEMMLAQPKKEQYAYRDIAMEAVLNPMKKSRMLQKLYADIIAKSDIDFGKIPDSKGDITAYVHYRDMTDCMESLNTLITNDGGDKELLKTMNDLHSFLISQRGDFEYGFKMDIPIIQTTYEVLAMALHIMICVCTNSYVDYLKESQGIGLPYKKRKMTSSNRMVVRNVRSILESYKRGEWAKLMSLYRKNGSNFLGGAAVVVGVSALAAVGVLFAVRSMIYFFYAGSFRIKDFVSVQAALLEKDILMDPEAKGIEKRKRLLSKLTSISDFIEGKILKSEEQANTALKQSNAETFSSSELRAGLGDPNDVRLL